MAYLPPFDEDTRAIAVKNVLSGRLSSFAHRPFLTVLMAVASLLTASIITADTLATVIKSLSPLPYFDEWYSLDLFRRISDGEDPLLGLFTYHNEHLIFLPRLVFFADYMWLGGQGVASYISILIIQMSNLILMLCLLKRSTGGGPPAVALAGVITTLMFSLRQSENFVWGFQVQFVGVFALASLASILFSTAITRYREGRSASLRLACAYGVALSATYCMANGLLVGATLVILAIIARAPKGIAVASLIVSGILLIAYMSGYGPRPGPAGLEISVTHLWAVALFAATYLGNFLDPHIVRAEVLGFCGLLAACSALIHSLVDRGRDGPRLALLGIILFTASTAILTAVGRADSGVEQGFSSRYSTGSGIFWSALLTFWSSVATRRRFRSIVSTIVTGVALILVSGAIEAQRNMNPA